MEPPSEHELAYLLDFDGSRYLFDEGYWLKIEVRHAADRRASARLAL